MIYVDGDVTEPQTDHMGPRGMMICHLVNDINLMGSGVAKALYTKWPEVKKQFHKEYIEGYSGLGIPQYVQVAQSIVVANLVAQTGVGPPWVDYVDYYHLEMCLRNANGWAEQWLMNVVMPKIGSLRAGGSWPVIEEIINRVMTVPVYIYLFNEVKP